jgi:hypothetical protein
MWRVCRSAGRPWPVVCPEDDVIDYMIMEAVALKARKQDEQDRKEADKKAEIEKFKKDAKEALGKYQ